MTCEESDCSVNTDTVFDGDSFYCRPHARAMIERMLRVARTAKERWMYFHVERGTCDNCGESDDLADEDEDSPGRLPVCEHCWLTIQKDNVWTYEKALKAIAVGEETVQLY